MVIIKNLAIAIVGIALAVIIYSVMTNGRIVETPQTEDVATTTPKAPEVPAKVAYQNDTYGISFSYPAGYTLIERSEEVHSIGLFRSEDLPVPPGGEGPPGITVEISAAQNQTLFEWLDTGNSNYSPEDEMSSALSSTTVSGSQAAQYTWLGLYGGETTAFKHKDNIIAVSVTYFSPEDENIAVYRNLLQSFELR